MKAWLLDELKGVSGLRLGEVPDPIPGPGEVVLRLQYSALNPADRHLAAGQYPAKPTLPHIVGRDGVGVVEAVGTGVTSVGVGDTRAILRGEAGVSRWGTFADKVALPANLLVEVPAGWSLQQAGAAPLVYLTSSQALTQFPDMPSSGVVLITGASGGVGVASIHLARAMGLTPVALSRSLEKKDALLAQGAASVFAVDDSGTWKEDLYAAHGRRPVVLAIDNIGGTLLPQVIDTLGQNGRVSVVGQLAGPVPNFNFATLFFRRIQIRGVALSTFTQPESIAHWGSVLSLLGKTNYKPLIDTEFAFKDLPAAFARMTAGPIGKVVIRH